MAIIINGEVFVVLTPWERTCAHMRAVRTVIRPLTQCPLLTVDPWANDISDGPFFIYVGPINLY